MLQVPDCISPINAEWFCQMERFFLGYILWDELDRLVNPLIVGLSADELSAVEAERKEWFEKLLGPILAPEDDEHPHILEPHRRRFVLDFTDLNLQEAVWHSKGIPDNCIIVQKGKNLFDVRSTEEVGFARVWNPSTQQHLLVGRTSQSYLVYGADGEWTRTVTEPISVIIPDISEEAFFDAYPFVRIAGDEGIMFTCECACVTLAYEFCQRTCLPTDKALVAVAYKHSLNVTKKPSKRRIYRSVYRGVVA